MNICYKLLISPLASYHYSWPYTDPNTGESVTTWAKVD